MQDKSVPGPEGKKKKKRFGTGGKGGGGTGASWAKSDTEGKDIEQDQARCRCRSKRRVKEKEGVRLVAGGNKVEGFSARRLAGTERPRRVRGRKSVSRHARKLCIETEPEGTRANVTRKERRGKGTCVVQGGGKDACDN